MKILHSNIYNTSTLFSGFFAGFGLFIAGMSEDASALPTGGVVTSGNANIVNTSANSTVVTQTTGSTIINWTGFNILKGESTQFIQPSSSAVALNRITGGNPTEILGSLSANGHLMIINPDGVFFGSSSRVNVGGLIASTNDITDSNFNAGTRTGHYAFTQAGKADASIVNKGLITASQGGLVALVAPGVVNDGVIKAKTGTVALGAGNAFTVDFYGDNLYSFAVTAPTTAQAKDQNGNALAAAITNNGKISAEGGTVYMTARAASTLVSEAINNTGIIEATTAHDDKGTIVLDGGDGDVTVAGKLDTSGNATGQQGGTIDIVGKDITLANAKINASGNAGGGTVAIGTGLGTTEAENVSVDAGSRINVSAKHTGNGGSVSLKSKGTTQFAGVINAKGGKNGGNGGLIETSGNTVNIGGTVALDAPKGNGGTWLLDPVNLTINSTLASMIDTVLNSGASFTAQASNNIEVASNIQKTSGSADALTLTAGNTITLDNGISIGMSGLAKALNINLNADQAAVAGAGTLMNAGSGINTLGNIAINGGNVSLTQASLTADNVTIGNSNAIDQVTLDNNSAITAANNLSINNTGVFFSNTASVLLGAIVSFNQNVPGSIQNAIDAINVNSGSSTLTLGSGTFAQQILIDNGLNNFTLTGQGAGHTTIAPVGAITAENGITPVLYIADANNIVISNLSVNDSAVSGTNITGIDASKITNLAITGNSVTTASTAADYNYGIELEDTNNAQITGNTVTGGNKGSLTLTGSSYTNTPGSIGVLIEDSNDTTLTSNSISNTLAGIVLVDAQGTNINKNTLTGNSVGIAVIDGSDNTHTYGGNQISGGTYGIYTNDSNALNIGNNTITGTGTGYGIDMVSSIASSVDGNTVSGFTNDINVLSSGTIRITGNTASNAGYDGIYADDLVAYRSGDTSTIADNTVSHTGHNGIEIDGSSNVLIGGPVSADANHLSTIGWDGINVQGGGHNTIQGNQISNVTGASGIAVFSGTIDNTVEDNTIANTGRLGIYIGGTTGSVITGNSISNTGLNGPVGFLSGISIEASSDALISGNTINGTKGSGIDTGGAINYSNPADTNITISGNTLRNTTLDGIYSTDGTNIAVTGNNVQVAGNGIHIVGDTGDTVTGNTLVSTSGLDSGIALDASRNATAGPSPTLNPNSANITISGNSITGFATGINVDPTSNLTVSGNNISGTGTGIALTDDSNVTVSGNTLTDTGAGGTGIFITGDTGTTAITGNSVTTASTAADYNYGIELEDTNNAQITGNTVTGGNKGSLTLTGSSYTNTPGSIGVLIEDSNDTTLTSNSISNTLAGIVLVDAQGTNINKNTLTGNSVGIAVIDGSDNTHTYGGNQISGGTYGIYTNDSNALNIGNNTITGTGTGYGIDMVSSIASSVDGNTVSGFTNDINVLSSGTIRITGNTASNAGYDGIYADDLVAYRSGDTSTIADNTVSHTGHNGIEIDGSSNVLIGGPVSADANHLSTIGWDGINVQGGGHNTIQGNQISNVTGASGIAVFSGTIDNTVEDNTIANTGRLGIYIGGTTGSVITGNSISNTGLNGPVGFLSGISIEASSDALISGNTINGTKGSGIDTGGAINYSNPADTNITISGNTLRNTTLDGIYSTDGTNIAVTGNNVQVAGNGIHIVGDTGDTVTGNTLVSTSGLDSGIALDASRNATAGPSPTLNPNSANITISGNSITGFATGINVDPTSNLTVSGNNISGTGTGIALTDDSNVTVSGNTLTDTGAGGTGIFITGDTGTTAITGNSITDFSTGVEIANTNNVQFASNIVTGFTPGSITITGNTASIATPGSIGVLIENSNNTSFSGDSLSNNLAGIALVNAQNTVIDGVTLTGNSVGIGAVNSSGNTLVSDTTFASDYIGVALDGSGTSLQFDALKPTSTFTNDNYYFVLQNGAMDNAVLDASQQNFDGTFAHNFTFPQWQAAEARTIDANTPVAGVGTVFYTSFPSTSTISANNSLANDLHAIIPLTENTLAEPSFSYAGQTILTNPPSFRVQQVNLSLLAPAAGGPSEGIKQGDGASLQNLAPAAGGDNSQLAELSPAAGGGNCGNGFLNSGYAVNYNADTCRNELQK